MEQGFQTATSQLDVDLGDAGHDSNLHTIARLLKNQGYARVYLSSIVFPSHADKPSIVGVGVPFLAR
jgi:hypothetical protein